MRSRPLSAPLAHWRLPSSAQLPNQHPPGLPSRFSSPSPPASPRSRSLRSHGCADELRCGYGKDKGAQTAPGARAAGGPGRAENCQALQGERGHGHLHRPAAGPGRGLHAGGHRLLPLPGARPRRRRRQAGRAAAIDRCLRAPCRHAALHASARRPASGLLSCTPLQQCSRCWCRRHCRPTARPACRRRRRATRARSRRRWARARATSWR